MGDQWFVEERIVKRWNLATTKQYAEWHFRNEIAGYMKQFASQNFKVNLVTVKGAGHMVPMDRPGPAMQMISNFFNDRDLSLPLVYSTQNVPLKRQYQIQEMVSLNSGTEIFRNVFLLLVNKHHNHSKSRRIPQSERPPPRDF